MLSILDLPVELLCHVTDYLDDGDLSTWCRAGSRLIFEIATPILYSRVKNEPGVFCWACDEGRIGTVERLLAVGTNPDVEWVDDERRSRTLTRLCLKDFYAQKLITVPERDAESDADFTDEDSNYSSGDQDSDSDAEVDWRDIYSWTPLHIAAYWGHDDIANLLLGHGAGVNHLARGFCECCFAHDWTRQRPRRLRRPTPSWSPLHTAICNGNESTAKLLISRGASTTNVAGPKDGLEACVTALHTACWSGATSLVRLLIADHQADVGARDHLGQTPRELCVLWRHVGVH